VYRDGARERLHNRTFVLVVARTAVVRQERHFAPRIELAQQVERSNLAAGVDRQQLAVFDPQNLHAGGAEQVVCPAPVSCEWQTITPAGSSRGNA